MIGSLSRSFIVIALTTALATSSMLRPVQAQAQTADATTLLAAAPFSLGETC